MHLTFAYPSASCLDNASCRKHSMTLEDEPGSTHLCSLSSCYFQKENIRMLCLSSLNYVLMDKTFNMYVATCLKLDY